MLIKRMENKHFESAWSKYFYLTNFFEKNTCFFGNYHIYYNVLWH